MLSLPRSVRIYVASTPVDMRMGHDGLFAVVGEQWKKDPYDP
jgi:transposase